MALAGLSVSASCVAESLATVPKRSVKIGICDWILGESDLDARFAMAKRIGADGVQVRMRDPAQDLLSGKRELQESYLACAGKHGLEIGSLTVTILGAAPLKSDAKSEQWLLSAIEIAKAMNVKTLLLPFFGKADIQNDKAATDEVVRRLKKIAPCAKDAGIALGLESVLSARELEELLERIGSSAVKVYYDVGNTQQKGYDVVAEIRTLGDRICEFHAKDNKDLFGKGAVDFQKVGKAIAEIRYSGWMHIEGTKTPLGVEESYRRDTAFLRTVLAS